MPGRGVLADRAGPGVAGTGHPDVAAVVQRDAGRSGHPERGAVAPAGGKRHDPAVALSATQTSPEEVTASATGWFSWPGPPLAEPKMASTRPAEENSTTRSWPVSATQTCPAASWRFRPVVQAVAEGGQLPPGGGELHHPVWPVSATQMPPAGPRPAGWSRPLLLPRRPPEPRRGPSGFGRVAADARGAGRLSAGGAEASGAGDQGSGKHAGAREGDYPRLLAAPPGLEAHRPAK